MIGYLLDEAEAVGRVANGSICANGDVFEVDFRSAAAINRRIIARGDSLGIFRNDEHADALRVAAATGSPCRDDQMRCPRRADHNGLVARDLPAAAVFRSGGFEVCQVVAAFGFGIGKGENALTRDQGGEMVFLLGRGTCLQEAACQDNGLQKRLDHEAFAKLFHHDHCIDRAAAEAAIFFGEGRCQQTELSKLGPHFRPPAVLRGDDLAPGVKVILVLDQPCEAVADHCLFFSEIEIHGCYLLPAPVP